MHNSSQVVNIIQNIYIVHFPDFRLNYTSTLLVLTNTAADFKQKDSSFDVKLDNTTTNTKTYTTTTTTTTTHC